MGWIKSLSGNNWRQVFSFQDLDVCDTLNRFDNLGYLRESASWLRRTFPGMWPKKCPFTVKIQFEEFSHNKFINYYFSKWRLPMHRISLSKLMENQLTHSSRMEFTNSTCLCLTQQIHSSVKSHTLPKSDITSILKNWNEVKTWVCPFLILHFCRNYNLL